VSGCENSEAASSPWDPLIAAVREWTMPVTSKNSKNRTI